MYFILPQQVLVENFGRFNKNPQDILFSGFITLIFFVCVSPSYRLMININPALLDF